MGRGFPCCFIVIKTRNSVRGQRGMMGDRDKWRLPVWNNCTQQSVEDSVVRPHPGGLKKRECLSVYLLIWHLKRREDIADLVLKCITMVKKAQIFARMFRNITTTEIRHFARPQIFTAVKIQGNHPEDRGRKIHRNVVILPPRYVASRSRSPGPESPLACSFSADLKRQFVPHDIPVS